MQRACLSVRLSVCRQSTKTQFSQKLSNSELQSLLTTYRKSYIGFSKNTLLDNGPLKSKMAETRYLENRHDVIFFCWGWSDLDKISQTGAEWHVNCGDMVKIETKKCRIPIRHTFERIPWHVIPEPRITLQGVATCATWWIHCHDSRATMPHCRVQSPGEINVMIVPYCRV